MADNTARITWTANTEPDLAGYRVYYGRMTRNYIGFTTVAPTATSATFQTEFTNDGFWYFTVTAFDSSNNESAFSAEVNKRIIRIGGIMRRRR